MIVVKTPHRISLFGGGTDYPTWFENHGGEVIAGAIDKFCYLTVRELPPFFDHKYRVVYRKIETVDDIDLIDHPAVRESIRSSRINAGLEIHHDSDLPARTGIGSSSAFSVGFLHALAALKGENPTSDDLANEAISLERSVLKEYGGHQDQIVSAHGGLNNIRFASTGLLEIRDATNGDLTVRRCLEDSLLMVFTGVKRNSTEVASTFVGRLLNNANDKYLESMMSITKQAQAILDSGNVGRINELGALLNETWQLKSFMNPMAVTAELAHLHREAMLAGALGGKIAGAGGGGFCVFLVPIDRQAHFIKKIEDHLVVPFRFVNDGSMVVYDSGERVV